MSKKETVFTLEVEHSQVVEDVRTDLLIREKKGFETYNTNMDRKDLTELEWLTHAYEECLDQAVYLKKLITIKSK